MSEIRTIHGLTMMYKVVNGLSPNYLADLITFTNEVHQVNTRSRKKNIIWIPKNVKSKSRRNAFIFSMSTLYNKLPDNITKAVNVKSFKLKLNKLIKENKITLPENFI